MTVQDMVYAKLPLFAQHLAISGYGIFWKKLRFGPGYTQFLTDYLKRESFLPQDWENWQNIRLQEILRGAMTAPYYAQTWTKTQKHAANANRLLDLPLLDKESLRSSPKSFVRTDMLSKRTFTFYTSGSTGTPIATIWTVAEIRNSIALREARSAGWAGVSFRQGRATFSGRLVEPDPNSKGPFYRYNAAEKQVYFSPFHIRLDTAHFYVEALIKHKVQWMTGYAVSFYLLAKFILESGLEVPPLKAIITTSEKLTHEMRETMVKAYHCRIYEEYSTVENTLFASECEHGRLHVSPDVGIVEILRPDDSPCKPNETGEVVATSLMRSFQPMIRYRLGDLAAWDPEPCPCGRSMPVIKEILGRIEDIIIGPDGRQMVRFHGIFVNQPHIIEGQIIQKEIDHIHVKVVPTDNFVESDRQDIIYRVQQRLGKSINVSVEKVDMIPRTTAGKFKAVISLIKH